MKKAWFFVLVLGAMFLCQPEVWAKARNPRITSRSHKMHPPKDKPFEGEWRTCRKHKKTGKLVCASHFFLQQGKQVCGTWQELGEGDAIVYSGFLQAHMEPEEFRGQEGADYMAQVDFVCSKDGDSIIFFSRPICGNEAKEVAWRHLKSTQIGRASCRERV